MSEFKDEISSPTTSERSLKYDGAFQAWEKDVVEILMGFNDPNDEIKKIANLISRAHEANHYWKMHKVSLDYLDKLKGEFNYDRNLLRAILSESGEESLVDEQLIKIEGILNFDFSSFITGSEGEKNIGEKKSSFVQTHDLLSAQREKLLQESTNPTTSTNRDFINCLFAITQISVDQFRLTNDLMSNIRVYNGAYDNAFQLIGGSQQEIDLLSQFFSPAVVHYITTQKDYLLFTDVVENIIIPKFEVLETTLFGFVNVYEYPSEINELDGDLLGIDALKTHISIKIRQKQEESEFNAHCKDGQYGFYRIPGDRNSALMVDVGENENVLFLLNEEILYRPDAYSGILQAVDAGILYYKSQLLDLNAAARFEMLMGKVNSKNNPAFLTAFGWAWGKDYQIPFEESPLLKDKQFSVSEMKGGALVQSNEAKLFREKLIVLEGLQLLLVHYMKPQNGTNRWMRKRLGRA